MSFYGSLLDGALIHKNASGSWGKSSYPNFNPTGQDWGKWLQGMVRRGTEDHAQQVWEQKEQMWMSRIFSDPSIKRMMSEEGRASLFGDMANQYDQSYRQARTAGIGSFALSGLSGSGARAMLESRMARDRAGALSEASSRATMGHASWVGNFLGSMMNKHFGRYLAFQGHTWNHSDTNKQMLGQAISGVAQGAGMAVGMA